MSKKETKTSVKEAEVLKTVPELKAELLTLQKSLRDGTLTNPHAIRAVKKQIARALTSKRQSELANKEGD